MPRYPSAIFLNLFFAFACMGNIIITTTYNMKKFHMFKCCVLFKLDTMLFSSSYMLLLVYWYMVVVGTCWPFMARKCQVYRTCPIAPSIATNSASVEPFYLVSFAWWCICCSFSYRSNYSCVTSHVWMHSTPYELPTHHFGLFSGYMVSVFSVISLRYYITLVSFL